MYRRRGQKPHWPRLRPAAEHSRAERHGDGTGLFLWSRSDAPIRVAWRERGAQREGTSEGQLNWSLSSWRIKPHNFGRSRRGGHIHFALLHYSLGDCDPHQMHSCMPLRCTSPALAQEECPHVAGWPGVLPSLIMAPDAGGPPTR